MKKLLKEPLVHFLALGLVIFAVNAWREKTRPIDVSPARIEVNEAVIARLRAGFERQFGQAPDSEEMRGLVTAHIREEVLCREALALGLDRDDTIVRRRLAQKMEFLTDDVANAAEPEEAAIRQFFAENATRYTKPGRVSFRHIYFSKDKRGARTDAAASEALAAMEKGGNDEAFGDPFLHGFEFTGREEEDVMAAFGPEFAKQIAAQPPGAWAGPVRSSYGLHLVRVTARMQPREVKFDEVRAKVISDFSEERRRTANREVFERLRQRYDVKVDEAALAKAGAPTTRTVQR